MDNIILSPLKINDLELLIQKAVRNAVANSAANPEPVNEIMSFEEACQFLRLAPQTVYNLVHQKKIPNSKKGKRLFFKRGELLKWVDSGKRS